MRKLGKQKLLESLRGTGSLRAVGFTVEVTYEMDRFEDNQGKRASGSVTGDVSALTGSTESTPAVLILRDGSQLPVLVSNAAEDGADFESAGPITGQ